MSAKARKLFSLLLASVLMLTSIFAFGDAPSAQAAKKAKLKTKNIKIVVGQKKKITFKKKIKKAKFSYKSKDKKIATVTKKGKITGKKAGKTTIYVKQKIGKKYKKVGNVKVTVTPKATTNAQPSSAPTNDECAFW